MSNLRGGVSMDDDMVRDAILPKLQQKDILLDFVHIAEGADTVAIDGKANGSTNGAALTATSDGLALIDQVHAGLGFQLSCVESEDLSVVLHAYLLKLWRA